MLNRAGVDGGSEATGGWESCQHRRSTGMRSGRGCAPGDGCRGGGRQRNRDVPACGRAAGHQCRHAAQLGDVGDPQLARTGRANWRCTRSDEVGVWCLGPARRLPGRPFDPGSVHQHLDRALSDDDARAEGQLGVHPPSPIGLPPGLLHGADLVGQPGVPDRRAGERAGDSPPGAEVLGDVVPPEGATSRSTCSRLTACRSSWPPVCSGCPSRATTNGGTGRHQRALISRTWATCATGIRATTRSRTLRRNSGGYGFGTSVSTGMIDHSATRLRETGGTSEPPETPARCRPRPAHGSDML